jgi:hypothetical protein
MSSLETIVQGGRDDREPSLDDVRLNDGSPVSFALIDQGSVTMDRRSMEEAKSTMRQLFTEDQGFVFSLSGLSAQEASQKISDKLGEMEKGSNTLH